MRGVFTAFRSDSHTRLLSEGGVGVGVGGGWVSHLWDPLCGGPSGGKKKKKKKRCVCCSTITGWMLLSFLLSHLKPHTHAVHARSTVTPQQNATKEPRRCLNAASHTGSPVKNAAFFFPLPPILNTSRCVFYTKAVSEKSNTHARARAQSAGTGSSMRTVAS